MMLHAVHIINLSVVKIVPADGLSFKENATNILVIESNGKMQGLNVLLNRLTWFQSTRTRKMTLWPLWPEIGSGSEARDRVMIALTSPGLTEHPGTMMLGYQTNQITGGAMKAVL